MFRSRLGREQARRNSKVPQLSIRALVGTKKAPIPPKHLCGMMFGPRFIRGTSQPV
jgi:hypothetical protein